MEVDFPELGDGDQSDTTDSDWGSDLENSQKVVHAMLFMITFAAWPTVIYKINGFPSFVPDFWWLSPYSI